MNGQPQEGHILGHPALGAPPLIAQLPRKPYLLLEVERYFERVPAEGGVRADGLGEGDPGEAANDGEGALVAVAGPHHGVVILQPFLHGHGDLVQAAATTTRP